LQVEFEGMIIRVYINGIQLYELDSFKELEQTSFVLFSLMLFSDMLHRDLADILETRFLLKLLFVHRLFTFSKCTSEISKSISELHKVTMC